MVKTKAISKAAFLSIFGCRNFFAAALANALVEARNQPGPGDKMGGGRKGRHIGPDLGDNGLDRNSTESWYLVQPVDDIAKGRKRILDSDIERDNAFLQLFDSLQMLCEEETMVFGPGP